MPVQCACIETVDQFQRLLKKCMQARLVGFDTETGDPTQGGETLDLRDDPRGEQRAKSVGLSLAFNAGYGFYVPYRHGEFPDCNLPLDIVKAGIRELFDAARPRPLDPDEPKLRPLTYAVHPDSQHLRIVGFNLAFDFIQIQSWLAPGYQLHEAAFEDPQLAAQVMDPSFVAKALKPLIKDLDIDALTPSYQEITRGRLFGELDPRDPEVFGYAARDAAYAVRLAEHYLPRLGADEVTYRIEKRFTPVVAHVARQTIPVDQARAAEVRAAALEEANALRAAVNADAERFGLADDKLLTSTKKLATYLFGEAGHNAEPKPPLTPSKAGYTTAADILEQYIPHPTIGPMVDKILRAKTLITLARGPLRAIAESAGEVTTSYHQIGARSGRMSTSGKDLPHGLHLQGVPKSDAIRSLFIAAPGTIMVACDVVSEELWVGACLSGEKTWLDMLREGRDFATETARRVYNDPTLQKSDPRREQLKPVIYGSNYGGGAPAASRSLGIPETEAQELVDAYRATYPTYFAWAKRMAARVTKTNRYVSTPFGRKLDLGVHVHGMCVDVTAKDAANRVVQGVSADILKRAAVHLYERFFAAGILERGAWIWNLIHDEVGARCYPEHLDLVAGAMQEAFAFAARPLRWPEPIRVSISFGENWAAERDWSL